MSETCPKCGAKCIRTGPYFAILGELSNMDFIDATDKYYQNRNEYRDDLVSVFKCGNAEVAEE